MKTRVLALAAVAAAACVGTTGVAAPAGEPVLAAAVQGAPAGGGKVVIKFAHNQQTNTPPHRAAEMFKRLVEERTGGYYDVRIFPAQQLGSQRDQVEGTSLGTIELTQQPAGTVSLLVPRLMLLDFPFLWTSEEVMWRVLDGALGQEMLRSLEARGLEGVDFWSSGFKNFTSSRQPIRTPDDFKGLKIRVIPSPLLSAQFEAWGAAPTSIDFKELYTALQQGVVDGQENPPGSIVDVKLHEVQKYMTESRHGFLHYVIMFNKRWFDAQPKAHRAVLVQAIKEVGRWERKAMTERDADATRRIGEAGVEIVALTPESRARFRELSLTVHARFADRVGREFLDKVYEEIQRLSK